MADFVSQSLKQPASIVPETFQRRNQDSGIDEAAIEAPGGAVIS